MIEILYNKEITINEVSEAELKNITQVENPMGYFVSTTNDIYLLKSLKPQIKKETLVHEIVHSIRFLFGHGNKDMDNEQVSDFIAAHIDEINRIVKKYFEKARDEK